MRKLGGTADGDKLGVRPEDPGSPGGSRPAATSASPRGGARLSNQSSPRKAGISQQGGLWPWGRKVTSSSLKDQAGNRRGMTSASTEDPAGVRRGVTSASLQDLAGTGNTGTKHTARRASHVVPGAPGVHRARQRAITTLFGLLLVAAAAMGFSGSRGGGLKEARSLRKLFSRSRGSDQGERAEVPKVGESRVIERKGGLPGPRRKFADEGIIPRSPPIFNPNAPPLEGDMDGVLSDHDEVPTVLTGVATSRPGAQDAGAAKSDFASTGFSSTTNSGSQAAEASTNDALSFDVMAGWKLWDAEVGCARFREKHRALIERYSSGAWVPGASLQRPFQPGTDSCSQFKKRHITVRIKNARWLVNWVEASYTCACGITCVLARSPTVAYSPDGELYEAAQPPLARRPKEPYRILMNMENTGKLPVADLYINYSPRADVQCTFAGNMFHVDRNRYLSPFKRSDVPLFFAASAISPFRDTIARETMQVIKAHSVGRIQNNLKGITDLDMYPQCKHEEDLDHRTRLHCFLSHYKFALAIESHQDPAFVTEKFYYALEAGTVPVYYGAPDVAEFAPPDSFIRADGMDRMALRKLVLEAMNDTVKYMGYLAWKRCGVLGNYARARALSLDTMPCRLCEELSRRGGAEGS